MWIELRGRQHRVYYRNYSNDGPRKRFVAFDSRDKAATFIDLARLSSLAGALDYVGEPSEEKLTALLTGSPLGDLARSAAIGSDTTVNDGVGTFVDANRLAASRTRRVASVPVALDAFDPRVGVTFAELWARYLERKRGLEGTTREDYEAYGINHLLPFFGSVDVGLIQRTEPIAAHRRTNGAVYVDDWVKQMLGKKRLNNARRPTKRNLSIKFILNVGSALKQAFDEALAEGLVAANPALDLNLPKQDRREMLFLDDGAAYADLRKETHVHFRPLLDFLVGTGVRFGEAGGLLVRHMHLDADRPYVDIRLALKWVRNKRVLGRPKTPTSVRRIRLSAVQVEALRPLVDGRGLDEHVFTMPEGGPLHHGNFYQRYWKPAVAAGGRGVPTNLRIHDLRHTHASWLLNSGISTFLVQIRLGHSSHNVTTSIYGHITSAGDDVVLDFLEQRLPSLIDLERVREAEVISLTTAELSLPVLDVDDNDDLAA